MVVGLLLIFLLIRNRFRLRGEYRGTFKKDYRKREVVMKRDGSVFCADEMKKRDVYRGEAREAVKRKPGSVFCADEK